MTNALKKAFEVASRLPERDQDALAAAVVGLTSKWTDPLRVDSRGPCVIP